MNALLDAIRAAIAPDASDEARAAGAHACRTILTALEATPGEPLVAPPSASQAASPLQLAVSALRGMPPEQLLDLAIARLKAALPDSAAATVAPVQPIKFHLLPLPPIGGRR